MVVNKIIRIKCEIILFAQLNLNLQSQTSTTVLASVIQIIISLISIVLSTGMPTVNDN